MCQSVCDQVTLVNIGQTAVSLFPLECYSALCCAFLNKVANCSTGKKKIKIMAKNATVLRGQERDGKISSLKYKIFIHFFFSNKVLGKEVKGQIIIHQQDRHVTVNHKP